MAHLGRMPFQRRSAALVSALLCAVAVITAGTDGAAAKAASVAVDPPCTESTPDVLTGLPQDGPGALYCAEPRLPDPRGWAFGDGFPRTSGTGRYLGGAYFWSDWLYDDTGATGAPTSATALRQPSSRGTYGYPEANPDRARYASNGADVFRAAIGLDSRNTWWRIDWNTLVDANAPIAEFAFDTDANGDTGADVWPANAGVSSPGIERAMLVSARGAWLIDTETGVRSEVAELGGSLTVDPAARSFLVRIPRTALNPTERWTVRLAAGLANANGDGFLQLTSDHGALPGQPNVFNLAFRELNRDETPQDGNWFDGAQNNALTTGGDVSRFSVEVDWARLGEQATEPEPKPTGFVNRWYVSTHEFGQGVAYGSRPTYPGRVQPYLLYIPAQPPDNGRYPLTWHLHGRNENHNSSPSVQPRFLEQVCEARRSICLSPEGRDPAGFWRGAMRLDFFEVWNRVAGAYPLDADRTILGGVSMGAMGSYPILFDHPDLFAAAYFKSGSAKYPDWATPLFPELTTDQTNSIPRVRNARWNPVYAWHGMLDELVPYTDARATYDEFQRRGYRYVFDQYPAEDHVAPALQDQYDAIPDFLRQQGRVKTDPGRIDYRWVPSDVDSALGTGPHGAWWVQDVGACSTRRTASVAAVSGMRPEPAVHPEISTTALPDAKPSPAIREQLAWVSADAPAKSAVLTLELDNVAQIRLDLLRAGFAPGSPGTVPVTTECEVALSLAQLRPGTRVRLDSVTVTRADDSGQVTLDVPLGRHVLSFD